MILQSPSICSNNFVLILGTDCSRRWAYIRDYFVRTKTKQGTGSATATTNKRNDQLEFLYGSSILARKYDTFSMLSYLKCIHFILILPLLAELSVTFLQMKPSELKLGHMNIQLDSHLHMKPQKTAGKQPRKHQKTAVKLIWRPLLIKEKGGRKWTR